jgi:hypothetical protein
MPSAAMASEREQGTKLATACSKKVAEAFTTNPHLCYICYSAKMSLSTIAFESNCNFELTLANGIVLRLHHLYNFMGS